MQGFDSIVLSSMNGLPSGLSLQCEPSSCGVPGGSKGCGIISGTPPASSAGVYNIDIVTTTYGKFQALPIPYIQIDTFKSYYILQVFPGTGVMELQTSNSFIAEPNPAKDNINIQITLRKNEAESGELILINMLGQEMITQPINLKQGKNRINMNISNLPEGYYIVEFRSGELRLTQKVVISR